MMSQSNPAASNAEHIPGQRSSVERDMKHNIEDKIEDKAARKPFSMAAARLRKHADFQRVYRQGRKQFSQQMAYFFALRPATQDTKQPVAGPVTCSVAVHIAGPRIGLTTGKVLGKAVDRNRIKRRMREAVRHNLAVLTTPVDVVLHPRRSVKDVEFVVLQREVARIFAQIQRATSQPAAQAAAGKDAAGAEKPL